LGAEPVVQYKCIRYSARNGCTTRGGSIILHLGVWKKFYKQKS